MSLKVVSKGPIDINPSLVQVRIGNKTLSEPLLTWFTDAYMRYWGGGGGG